MVTQRGRLGTRENVHRGGGGDGIKNEGGFNYGICKMVPLGYNSEEEEAFATNLEAERHIVQGLQPSHYPFPSLQTADTVH